MARDDEQRGDEGFLQIGETEILRDGRNGGGENFGKLDGGLVLELLAPILTVHDTLLLVRERKQVLAVEAAGAAGQARVQAIEMVG